VIVEVFAGLNNAHPHVQRLREHRRIQLLRVLLQDGFGVLLSAHLRRDTHLSAQQLCAQQDHFHRVVGFQFVKLFL
jgi:hypothetical protein